MRAGTGSLQKRLWREVESQCSMSCLFDCVRNANEGSLEVGVFMGGDKGEG